MSLRTFLLIAVTACFLCGGCSSDGGVEVLDSADENQILLPSQELTAVGMTEAAAKLVIEDLGYSWVIASEDGVELLPGLEVPGRFNLHVIDGIVARQTVDGVKPYINVNAMDTVEAQDLIAANGWTYRVTVIDGVRVIEDDSRVPGRYNLWVTTGGKVVYHEIDVVRVDEIWEPGVAD
tara:strand:+ start:4978 stop:5514 length:537 start_codon:yes stop_codon:yes gene_type:complete